jgi:hypothetical protein
MPWVWINDGTSEPSTGGRLTHAEAARRLNTYPRKITELLEAGYLRKAEWLGRSYVDEKSLVALVNRYGSAQSQDLREDVAMQDIEARKRLGMPYPHWVEAEILQRRQSELHRREGYTPPPPRDDDSSDPGLAFLRSLEGN